MQKKPQKNKQARNYLFSRIVSQFFMSSFFFVFFLGVFSTRLESFFVNWNSSGNTSAVLQKSVLR